MRGGFVPRIAGRTTSARIRIPRIEGEVAILQRQQRQGTASSIHVLLHGTPGLGKTTLAYVSRTRVGGAGRATSGYQAIEKPGDLVGM